jgi:transcriptional regulator with XRE-family HTH domain
VKEVGKILREKRIELGYSQSNLAKIGGIRRENLRDVELMKRRFSVKNLKKVLNAMKLNVKEILRELF